MDELDNRDFRSDMYSKAVKAGKRTYFFDIKATKGNDFYLTITESKKCFDNETGKVFFDKHKMFLYPEDFEKFGDAFHEIVDLIQLRRNGTLTDEDLMELKRKQIQQESTEHKEEN